MPDQETSVTGVEPATKDPLCQLASAVEEIRQRLDRDQFHAGLVSKLQEELDGLRRGVAEKMLLPLITGVVRLHADVSRLLEAVGREPQEKATPERLVRVVADFHSDLELLLDHGGVTLFIEAGDGFNPHRQVAQRTEPSPEPALHRVSPDRSVWAQPTPKGVSALWGRYSTRCGRYSARVPNRPSWGREQREIEPVGHSDLATEGAVRP